MAGSSHKHINRLIGFVEDTNDGKAWIVLSLEPNGNVREFLGKGRWEIAERISLIRSNYPERIVSMNNKFCSQIKDTLSGINYLDTR